MVKSIANIFPCKNWNDEAKPIIVNGYEIKFNSFWNHWQVSHDEIGACIAEFDTLEEAKEYCFKG